MDRSFPHRGVAHRLGTASLVLVAFSVGRLTADLGASPAAQALVALALIGALAMLATRIRRPIDHEPNAQRSTGAASGQAPSSDDSSRAIPTGVNTFDVICSPPPSEGALAVIQDVIDGMVRPTDLVVRHTDGRLLVLVDAAGDHVRESFESRANVHVHVALAAAGMSPVGLTLRPVNAGA